MTKRIELLKKFAKKSNHSKSHHVTMLFRGGALVSVGVNRDKRHSEVVALKKVKNGTRGLIAVNFMIKPNGNIGCSMPCNSCLASLVKAGVEKVYYSHSQVVMAGFELTELI